MCQYVKIDSENGRPQTTFNGTTSPTSDNREEYKQVGVILLQHKPSKNVRAFSLVTVIHRDSPLSCCNPDLVYQVLQKTVNAGLNMLYI